MTQKFSLEFFCFQQVLCAEFDISVSKLLGFQTFAKSLRVSVSENKSRFWFRKIWSRKKSISFVFGEFGLRKKVSVLVSENLVSVSVSSKF